MPVDKVSEPRSEIGGKGRDLLWILLAGLAAVAVAALDRWVSLPAFASAAVQVLRVPFGLAYLLFMPGYCLTAALFPYADDIDGLERAGLSLGLSIAWIPALALALAQIPHGLSTWPILLGVLASTGLFAAVAAWRRARSPAGSLFVAHRWRPLVWWQAQPIPNRRVYALCAGAVLLAGMALTWTFLVPSPSQHMTEFYLLGRDGRAESYPREMVAGETITVTLGIANREGATCTYRVQLQAQGQQVGAAGPVVLQDGQVWERAIVLTLSQPGNDQPVEFVLFRDDGVEPYRTLRLWINVVEEIEL